MVRNRLRISRTRPLQPVEALPEESLRIETVTHHKLRWLNIENPTRREIDYLREHYPFHPLDLDDCLSKIQVPKIDEYEDYLFIVLHFPVYNPSVRVTTSSEVDIFIGEDYLITSHLGNLRPLVRFFGECQEDEKVRQANLGRSSGFLLYQILDRLVDYCFPILNKIIANVERVEDNIFDENVRDTVRELSVLRRDIISYRRIIKPQMSVVASLEQRDFPFLKEDLDVYFGDLADHMNKIWDTLEDYKEVVEGLNDTNNSLTSHRINDVIRVLTVISTIMLPLSVITGIYGMNISVLPFSETPVSFLVVVGFMLALAVGMLGIFKHNRWI